MLRPCLVAGRVLHLPRLDNGPNLSGATFDGTAADPIVVNGNIVDNGGGLDSLVGNVVEVYNNLQILEGCGFQTPPRMQLASYAQQ